MLFGKPKLVLWPRPKSTDFYQDIKENNLTTFDFSLWSPLAQADIASLISYVKNLSLESLTVLIPDDVVFTKSFIYDTQINTIDKSEVISLAESFVHFKIQPDLIEHNLVQVKDKTIIQAKIYDPVKLGILKANLSHLPLKSYSIVPVSSAVTKVIGAGFPGEYFLLYPLNSLEFSLILAQKDSVFLTSNHKSSSLEIQKIINYSNLYFSAPVNTLFLPQGQELDIVSTTKLEKTLYLESQIATSFKRPGNFPLPVIGCLGIHKPPTAIIDTVNNSSAQVPMENKKNILPLVAVFVVTAAIASIVIWFVMNRDSNGTIQSPSSNNQQPTPTVEVLPTETPVPTVAEIDKKLKIQVLNATDINGQAASLKSYLVSLGFKNATTGNTTSQSSKSLIRVKAGQEATGQYFVSKLAGYLDATVVADLDTTTANDVVMVIGGKLGTLPTISATPTTSTTVTPSTSASPSATTTKTP